MKTITLNFIGKSSVPFNRTIEVDSTVIDAYRGKSKSLSAIGQEYDAMYTIKKAISILI